MILLCKVDDPSRFGVATLDGDNIKKIIEKPKNPESDLAVIGVYFLTPKIFNIIDNLKPSWRGELEITDALDVLLARGDTVQFDIVTGWWKDTGTPEDILDANRLILDTIGKENQFKLQSDYEVRGNIVIGKNSTISRDCLVTGPVIIGHNCNIGPAVKIGPYVSIGNNSVLKNCDIENSIIMDNCVINVPVNVIVSIIANGSEITENTHPKKYQFLLGERSQVKL